MIDQLLKVIQENSDKSIVKNKEVPDKYNNAIQKEIHKTIEKELGAALKGGNITEVMNLFGSGAQKKGITNNPIVQSIINQVVGNMGKKYGLSPAISTAIANMVIPQVLSKFSQQTADPKDPTIDMNTVIGSLLGGSKKTQAPPKAQGMDFNDLLSQVTKGGKVDMASVAGQLLSGAASKKTQKSKGGLLDSLGDIFKS
jgi:hypothetical protein